MDKEEKREYKREYNLAHKEEIKEYQRKWRFAHKREIKEYNKKYNLAHKQENKKGKDEYNRKYRLIHKEEIKEYQREYRKEYYQENKEELSKQQKEHYAQIKTEQPWVLHFRNAKNRCNNPNHSSYKWYGGRGIQCLLTKGEVKTLYLRDSAKDMKRASIDRINNDSNYTFLNCRFIEQSENTRKSINLRYKRSKEG